MSASSYSEYKYELGKSFFFIVPNIIDDLGLDPYEFRYYCHILRIVGDVNGICYKSNEEICKSVGCGKTKLKEIKKRLSQPFKRLSNKPLIYVEHRKTESKDNLTDIITIANIWQENILEYTSEKDLGRQTTEGVGRQTTEGGRQTTTKNTHLKNTHSQKNNNNAHDVTCANDVDDNQEKKIEYIKNVYLSNEEYESLVNDFGNELVDEKIKCLSSHKKASKYKSHYLTLKNWCKKDAKAKEHIELAELLKDIDKKKATSPNFNECFELITGWFSGDLSTKYLKRVLKYCDDAKNSPQALKDAYGKFSRKVELTPTIKDKFAYFGGVLANTPDDSIAANLQSSQEKDRFTKKSAEFIEMLQTSKTNQFSYLIDINKRVHISQGTLNLGKSLVISPKVQDWEDILKFKMNEYSQMIKGEMNA